jgi:hypothetical protein
MHGPTGWAGVHVPPKSGHAGGIILPLSTSPHRQPGMGSVSGKVIPKRAKASMFS